VHFARLRHFVHSVLSRMPSELTNLVKSACLPTYLGNTFDNANCVFQCFCKKDMPSTVNFQDKRVCFYASVDNSYILSGRKSALKKHSLAAFCFINRSKPGLGFKVRV